MSVVTGLKYTRQKDPHSVLLGLTSWVSITFTLTNRLNPQMDESTEEVRALIEFQSHLQSSVLSIAALGTKLQ